MKERNEKKIRKQQILGVQTLVQELKESNARLDLETTVDSHSMISSHNVCLKEWKLIAKS